MFGFGRKKKKKFSEMTEAERLDAYTGGYQSDDYLKMQEEKEKKRQQREEEERRRMEEEEEERRRQKEQNDPLSAWGFVNKKKDDDGFGW